VTATWEERPVLRCDGADLEIEASWAGDEDGRALLGLVVRVSDGRREVRRMTVPVEAFRAWARAAARLGGGR